MSHASLPKSLSARSLSKAFAAPALAAALALAATGCATTFNTVGSSSPEILTSHLGGNVHGGSQFISGATVTLYSMGTGGYGKNANTLASTSTDARGQFNFTSTITCPSSNAPVYLISTGGTTNGSTAGYAAATANVNATLLAILGPCSTAINLTNVYISEVTTVAGAYAMAPYMNPGTTPGTEVIGGPGDYTAAAPLSQSATAIITASTNAGLLANITNGTAVQTFANTGTATTVAAVTVTGTPEYQKVNYIADILAACVNTVSNTATPTGSQTANTTSANCTTLFNNAAPPPDQTVTSQPSATFSTAVDTLQAALYMAINPTDISASNTATTTNTSTTNLTNLYNLPSGQLPYTPASIGSTPPSDWTIGIAFTAFNGTADTLCSNNAPFINYPYSISVDAVGNIWMANGGGATTSTTATTKMGPQGQPLVCSGVITGEARGGAVIDTNGNVWTTNNAASSVYRIDPTAGTTTTFTAAGKTYGIGADGSGNIFFTVPTGPALYGIAGTAAAGATPTSLGSITGASPYDVAVDTKGTIFTSQSGSSGSTISYTYPTKVGGVFTPGSTNGGYATPVALTASGNFAGLYGLAVDASGNFWYSNSTGTSATADTGPGNATGYIIPNDATTAVGTANSVAPTESVSSPPFEGGLQTARKVAIDGAGNIWYANNNTFNPQAAAAAQLYNITEFSKSGISLSPSQTSTTPVGSSYVQNGGFIKSNAYFNQSRGIAVDPSGNVWISATASTSQTLASGSLMTELIGAAVPVVTPISKQLSAGTGPVLP